MDEEALASTQDPSTMGQNLETQVPLTDLMVPPTRNQAEESETAVLPPLSPTMSHGDNPLQISKTVSSIKANAYRSRKGIGAILLKLRVSLNRKSKSKAKACIRDVMIGKTQRYNLVPKKSMKKPRSRVKKNKVVKRRALRVSRSDSSFTYSRGSTESSHYSRSNCSYHARKKCC